MKISDFGKYGAVLIICIYFLVTSHSCRNSESPKIYMASIDISVEPDPVIFIWHEQEGYAEFDCLVTIYEMVGIGGNIDKLTFKCIFENIIREEFSSTGGHFFGFRYITEPFKGKVDGKVDRVEITAVGRDDNGHRLEKTKNFSVKWEEE